MKFRDSSAALLAVPVLCALLVLSAVPTAGAPQAPTAEPNDGPETATALGENATATAELTNDDADWYAVDVDAGQAVVATVPYDADLPRGAGLRVDVFAPDGERVGETPNALLGGDPAYTGRYYGGTRQRDARAADVANESGTYYVRVAESDYDERADGRAVAYDLSVRVEDRDAQDANEGPESATRVDGNAAYDGVFSPYDPDWYAVNATAGERIDVRFRPGATPAGSDWDDPTVFVVTPAGDRIDVADLSPTVGDAVEARYRAEGSGTYYVVFDQGEDTATLAANRTYRNLTVTVDGGVGAVEREPNQDRSEATPVGRNVTVAGDLDGDFQDWYAVNATVGERLSADVEVADSTDDVAVELYDADGRLAVAADDGGAASAPVDEPGTYYVRILPEAGTGSIFVETEYRVTVSVVDCV